MEVGVLSMRYAKAMIEYAQEKGVEDRLYNEFFILSHSFRTQPGLREALDNPVISMKDKLVLVCTAADGDGKSSREFIRFITLVLRNRREGYLQFISRLTWTSTGNETHRSRQADYGCPGGQGRKTASVPQQRIFCMPRWNWRL